MAAFDSHHSFRPFARLEARERQFGRAICRLWVLLEAAALVILLSLACFSWACQFIPLPIPTYHLNKYVSRPLGVATAVWLLTWPILGILLLPIAPDRRFRRLIGWMGGIGFLMGLLCLFALEDAI